jgi:transcriptional regulator with XRE-family HTH domain
MYMAEFGARICQARKSKGLTRAALAEQAGISSETLNLLEAGAGNDLGMAEVFRLLRLLDLEIALVAHGGRPRRDYVRFAAGTGSTGFREPLGEEELLQALLSGAAPAAKRPHLRRLLEDSPPTLVHHLIVQVSEWSDAAEVRANLVTLAEALGVEMRPEWIEPG